MGEEGGQAEEEREGDAEGSASLTSKRQKNQGVAKPGE